jgi:hypothetical protein
MEICVMTIVRTGTWPSKTDCDDQEAVPDVRGRKNI